MSDTFNGPMLAIALSVLGAVCFAVAAVLQHRAVSAEAGFVRGGVGDCGTLSLRGVRAVARRRGWLAGLGLAAGGSVLHAVALALAPLAVVQPIGVLAVPIAVLLTSTRTGRLPGHGVVTGVVLSVAGVAGFVWTAAGAAVSTPPPGRATLVAGLAVAGVVLLLAGIGVLSFSGWVRCLGLATAGAVAFGLVSALVRAVSQAVTAGDVGFLELPVLVATAGVAAAMVVGGWLVQQAFTSGPPEVVVACLTVVDPIVAVLLGVLLLKEGASAPAVTWVQLSLAGLTATVGVIALAQHHPDAKTGQATRRCDVAGGASTSASRR